MTAGDTEYFCPMHPSVIRDNPKEKCPICFMPLSKRKKGTGEAEPLPAGIVSRVQLSPYRMVLAGVETWPVDYRALTKRITMVGFVEFNERGQKTVSARVKGRIDKMFVAETGRMVNAGDELVSLYSPDLLVAVQNLLQAKRSGNTQLVTSTRTKLGLLGIDEDQIDAILADGAVDTHLTIRSPIGGHIIRKYAREGQYVEEGTALYDIADLSTVWIQAQLYEDDLAFLPASLVHGELPDADQAPVVSSYGSSRAIPVRTVFSESAGRCHAATNRPDFNRRHAESRLHNRVERRGGATVGTPFNTIKVEWVLGVALPVGLTRDTPDLSVVAYMSIEHSLRKVSD